MRHFYFEVTPVVTTELAFLRLPDSRISLSDTRKESMH